MMWETSGVISVARLLRRAFWPYRYSLALMTVLSFLGGALEGIGVNAVIPLFSFIGGGGAAPTDGISLALRDAFLSFGLPYSARALLALIVFLFLTKTVLLLAGQYVTAAIMTNFEKSTRGRLIMATLNARWPFLSVQKVGYLDQLLTTDVSSSAAILTYLSSAVLVLVNIIIYTVLIFNVSPTAALLSFVFGVALFVIFKPLLSKTRSLSNIIVGKYKEIAHFANEHVIGAKIIKAMRCEQSAITRGMRILTDMRTLDLRVSFLRNLVPALLQLVGVFFIVGLFVFLYKTASFQFAAFAVVIFALNKVFSNLQFAQTNLHAISMQIPYLESVLRYAAQANAAREEETGGERFAFEKEVRFEAVDFKYPEKGPALSSVSFSFKRGEVVGIIGPSGAGKSTVADLLLRLIEPSEGRISIDGTDIKTVALREWRANVVYVPQDVFLFNDTIENNIKMYNSFFTDAQVREAARAAYILDFVESQSNGFQTPVGERGTALSGGQRQRIALARALVRRPALLILDEATSALDHESEAMIQKAIEKLRGTTTVIVVAHRLSTVLFADILVAIEQGRVIESGDPQRLLHDPSSYFFQMYAGARG